MDHLLTDVEVSSQVISLERIELLTRSEFTDIGRCVVVDWNNGNCLRIALRNQDIPGMHRIWADRPGIDILCLGHTWSSPGDETLWLHQGKIVPLIDDSRFEVPTEKFDAHRALHHTKADLEAWFQSRMTTLA